ncbi:MAG TPA: extracellular solute-binding protein [Kofleriaceae bacterium]|nr:extracellular solute-binding protein [Kofleriaceae bacterium]
MALVALAACTSACGTGGERGPGGGAVHLVGWVTGPEPSAFARKTNLIEGARRVNQELAAAGDPRRVSIDVDFNTTSHDPYVKKLVFAFASGRGPDIACGGHEIVGTFAPPGHLVPLDDFLAARPAFRDDFFPVLWGAMSWRGKVYAVPQDNEVRLAYIAKKPLRALGWTDADIAGLAGAVERGELSLDDMAGLIEKAVAAGAVKPERGVYHRNRSGFDWLQFLLANGARLEDPATGRLVLSRRATLETLRLFDRLVARRALPPGMTSYTERTIYRDFVAGDVLVWLTGGSWHKLEWDEALGLGDAAFHERIAYFPIPGGSRGQPPVSVSHPFGCAVATTAPDRELAFRVIERSIDPDLDVGHAIASSHLVVRKSSSESGPYKADPFLRDMIDLLRFTHFAPNHAKLTRLQRILFDGIRGVEVGVLSPDEALDFVLRACKARMADDVVIED